eukprot:1934923-Pleurochrysis_carterae.AAC.1
MACGRLRATQLSASSAPRRTCAHGGTQSLFENARVIVHVCYERSAGGQVQAPRRKRALHRAGTGSSEQKELSVEVRAPRSRMRSVFGFLSCKLTLHAQ